MKAILLDGSYENDVTGERVRAALTAKLQTQGWEVEYVLLREQKIGNCAGDFFCWIRNPGICNVDDDNRDIAESVVHSDLMVYLTPVTFGGYSSALKRMVDHQIQNISPYFAKVTGETHHQPRYDKYPNFLAIGWMNTPDARAETVFKYMAKRNAINFYAKTSVAGVILSDQTDGEISALVQNWLNDLNNGQTSQLVKLPANGNTGFGTVEIRRALLLVGSPRTRKSTSNSLGSYLFEQLSAQSIQTETIYIHTMLRSDEKMKTLLDAVDTADLVMLAFPLYVDSLPAPVIEALERIAAHRTGHDQTTRQLFAAIANCGFPEAHHNATALAICEIFAQQAGFDWAGSLALGAGAVVQGASLNEAGGPVIPIKASLVMAAEALAQGKSIPQAAQDLMAKPVIPAWMYLQMGNLGWKQQAQKYGAEKSLKRQPYEIAKIG